MLGRYSGLSIGQYTQAFRNTRTGEIKDETQLSVDDILSDEWEPVYNVTTGGEPTGTRKPQGMKTTTKAMIGISVGIAGIILFSMMRKR